MPPLPLTLFIHFALLLLLARTMPQKRCMLGNLMRRGVGGQEWGGGGVSPFHAELVNPNLKSFGVKCAPWSGGPEGQCLVIDVAYSSVSCVLVSLSFVWIDCLKIYCSSLRGLRRVPLLSGLNVPATQEGHCWWHTAVLGKKPVLPRQDGGSISLHNN